MKKILSLIIAFCICVVRFGSSVEAEENNDLKEVVIRATELMEELMEASYQKAEEEVKKKITETGYDYVLTMESFYQYGNPFSGIDYSDMISACCVLIKHGKGNMIYDMDMLEIKYQENNIEEIIPVKVKNYIMSEDGYYVEKGYRYITEECDCPVYMKVEGKKYKESGVIHIEPETSLALYAEIEFEVITGKKMIEGAGLDYELLKEEHSRRIRGIEHAGIDADALLQSVFIENIKGMSILTEEEYAALEESITSVNGNEAILLSTAISLIGNVPYEWGGKPEYAGYDKEWWTFGENGKQKGLDCSGYMQWVYMTAGYPANTYQNLLSTQSILHNTTPIEREELTVGDFGVLNMGESVNHVGMYIGNDYFIHCSSYAGTVTISRLQDANFRYFRTVDEKNTTDIQGTEVIIADSYQYTQEDVLLLAQLIYHEARGEGLNGWIAVGEVVMNRIYSDAFPNTLREVVYQQDPEQFSDSDKIESHEPTENMMNVAEAILSGQIRIFNDARVLYYRNPGNDEGDWGKLKYFQRIRNHVFYI